MAPSAISDFPRPPIIKGQSASLPVNSVEDENYSLDRSLQSSRIQIDRAEGNIYFSIDGRKILDGSGGASVACIGHGDRRVLDAMNIQMIKTTYCNSAMFSVEPVVQLSKSLAEPAGFAMAYWCSSGSEAMESTIKLARQFYVEIGQSQRVNFIAREDSYHGATLGALSMSGHRARRERFLPLLSDNFYRVSSCFEYRQRDGDESDATFVAKKADELEQLVLQLGSETVIGFVCEPIVGATLGCVPYVPGYLAAMKAVCTKYGMLFILDEVMCGMGRSGTLHAWQAEHYGDRGGDCQPDIQTIGKGLAGGYYSLAGILLVQKIKDAWERGSGIFAHGHTFQSSPVGCAAALAVQKVIRDGNLLENCRKQGAYMASLLHEALDSHANVGDIRGMGLFWGIEFVKNKATKEPFDVRLDIAQRIQDMAISRKYNLAIYKSQGTVDGVRGDHVILSPALNSTADFIATIVQRTVGAINDVFDELSAGANNAKFLNIAKCLLISGGGPPSAITDSIAINAPNSAESG